MTPASQLGAQTGPAGTNQLPGETIRGARIVSVASSGTLYSMELLARRLGALAELSCCERDLLLTRSHCARHYEAGAQVRMAEDPSLRATLIVSGWACREQITASGNRQLLSALLPGDLIWSRGNSSALDFLDVTALSSLTVINVAGAMRTVMQDPASFPLITRGLARLRLAEENYLIEHAVRLGAQTAHQRVAGLILELFERCRTIGFVTGQSFVMPLSQEILSDFAGLSVVHVHRVLRRLKADGFIRVMSGVVEILDRSGLDRIADVWCDRPRSPQTSHPHEDRYVLEMSAA